MEPREPVGISEAEPRRDDRSMRLLELGIALLAFVTVFLLTTVR